MNPLTLPQQILGAVGVAAICLAVGGWKGYDMGWDARAAKVPAELEAQKLEDKKACDKAQKLTRSVNDQLQKDRDLIAARLAELRQLTPACAPVIGKPDIQPSGPRHAGGNGEGLGTDWLRAYAARAEGYRRELVQCIGFLNAKKASETNPDPSR